MNVVVNKQTGIVTKIVSKCSVPQTVAEGEVEVSISDKELIDAFNRGDAIMYDKGSDSFYYERSPTIEDKIGILEEENIELKIQQAQNSMEIFSTLSAINTNNEISQATMMMELINMMAALQGGE